MDMTAFHRLTRLLLWRVAAICAVLLVAAWMFGAASVWQIVEWVPMTIVIVLFVVHVASLLRERS